MEYTIKIEKSFDVELKQDVDDVNILIDGELVAYFGVGGFQVHEAELKNMGIEVTFS